MYKVGEYEQVTNLNTKDIVGVEYYADFVILNMKNGDRYKVEWWEANHPILRDYLR